MLEHRRAHTSPEFYLLSCKVLGSEYVYCSLSLRLFPHQITSLPQIPGDGGDRTVLEHLPLNLVELCPIAYLPPGHPAGRVPGAAQGEELTKGAPDDGQEGIVQQRGG